MITLLPPLLHEQFDKSQKVYLTNWTIFTLHAQFTLLLELLESLMSKFDNITQHPLWVSLTILKSRCLRNSKVLPPKSFQVLCSKSHKWLNFNHKDFLPPHVYNVLICQIANDMCIFVYNIDKWYCQICQILHGCYIKVTYPCDC